VKFRRRTTFINSGYIDTILQEQHEDARLRSLHCRLLPGSLGQHFEKLR
jgi:hypothetical protein